jgi:hypothetical protein
MVELNLENPLTKKTLSFSLTQEAVQYKRWMHDFSELEALEDFLILYGSILHSPKEANDIDLLGVTTHFKKVDKIIQKVQISQNKKIHLSNMTKEELRKELRVKNRAYIDGIKKGVVLFGQDSFIDFIGDM